jgi:hypothetical protein
MSSYVDVDYYYDPYQARDDRRFEVNSIIADNASVAHVQYGDLEAFGDAKRNKGERRDSQVGRDLAEGRAFLDLGKQLIDRAMARLDCQDQ